MESNDGKIEFNEDSLLEDNASGFIEWRLIAIAECVAGNDATLLSILHRDMQSITPKEAGMLGSPRVDAQVAALLIEILCLVKHIAFYVDLGLQTLASSNS